MDLAEPGDHSRQVPLGLVAVTPDPTSSDCVAFLQLSDDALAASLVLLKRRVLSPCQEESYSSCRAPGSPFSCSTGFSPQNSKARKGKGILLLCLSFLFSLNQHKVDRGRCGRHLSWYVTKGGFPPEPQSFHPGSLEETSTASAQMPCKLSSMFAHILSTFSQGFFLLLGRWLAVVSRIRQGSRW